MLQAHGDSNPTRITIDLAAVAIPHCGAWCAQIHCTQVQKLAPSSSRLPRDVESLVLQLMRQPARRARRVRRRRLPDDPARGPNPPPTGNEVLMSRDSVPRGAVGVLVELEVLLDLEVGPGQAPATDEVGRPWTSRRKVSSTSQCRAASPSRRSPNCMHTRKYANKQNPLVVRVFVQFKSDSSHFLKKKSDFVKK